MLPSKGYFNDIECPYLENTCGRPYCHFNHRKKQLENVNETSSEDSSSREIPTYKPTPKSELAVRKSHIPISYVPDVYKVEKSTRSFRNNTFSDIVYKPTPISLLNSNVKSSTNNCNYSELSSKEGNSSNESNLETKYVPEYGMKSIAENEKIMKQNQDKYEYKPAEQESKYQYNPTSHKDINEDSLSDIVYKPNSSGLNNLPKVEYTPSICSKPNSNINFENLDSEFSMIDEIINMSDIIKNPEDCTLDTSENLALEKNLKESNSTKVNVSGNNLENTNTSHKKDKISKTNEFDSRSSTHETVKNSHRHKDRGSHSKESNKHNKKDKHCDTKDKSKDKKERKSGGEEVKRDRTDSKTNSKDEKKEKGDRSETKVKDTKKNDSNKSESSRSKDKDRKHSHSKKESEESKEGSSSKKETERKNKYKETEDKKKHGRSHSSHRERDKHKHSKHKSDNHKDDGKKEKGHVKYKDKKKEESSDSEFEKKKTDSEKPISLDFDYDIDMDIDEQQTMEECFRIFNEYKPTVTQEEEEEKSTAIKNEVLTADESVLSKKRIAHSNASNVPTKIQHPKPISKPTPGQVMYNRFKIIKASQADNEEKLISNELKNIAKRPQPTPLFKPPKKIKRSEEKPALSSNPSLIDEILNRTNSKPVIKKIAPVSNVLNLQKAKANLKAWSNDQSTEQLNKTIAQTNKTGKRQAHVPDYSLSDIPDVIDVDKSKLAVNVRSRYLTLLADECCKLYLTQKDAYKRALDEEYSCYQKCKVLVTYRNSAMLAVNRLRKEVKEREEKNLGLIGSDESSKTKREDAEKVALYNKIQQYLLTDEELDIHGYPRESSTPGRAVIKNRKITSAVPLPKNQKKCCRCSKIYLIDDEGKAIYEEECVYHPLKKRTIRGEHIYLCCKSSDDSGCATCHTHVSETPDDAELEGYQTTLPPNGDSDPRSNAIYALDCEMCYTTKGLELTRVTVIDTNCKTVYESLVKPLNEIIDYNTRFSGITKQQMDRTSTGILQVQANILHLCNSRTILIGHSLESDMKALKIIHGAIIDTAVLFPHKMGLPHKRALRTLASDYLKKIIQNDVGGHDSAEDAITCMELIKWKVKEDGKFRS